MLRKAALFVLGLGAVAGLWAQGVPEPLSLGFQLQARTLQGMRAQAATLLVQGGQGGQLAMTVLATPTGRAVPVLVELEGVSLFEADTDETIRRIEIYAYALTPEGAVRDFLTQTLRLDVATWGERVFSSGIKLVGHLELPPGAYSLRVLAFDVATQRFGLRTQPLVVPDPARPQPRILSVLAAEPPGTWLLARAEPDEPQAPEAATGEPAPEETPARKRDRGRRPQETDPTPAAEETPAGPPPLTPEEAVRPLVTGGAETTLPAAWPVLEAGQEIQLDLMVSGMPEAVEIAARLEPEAEGAAAIEAGLEPLAHTVVADALERWAFRLRVPADLPTAAYRLSLTADNGASYALPILLLAENPGGQPMVWGQIRSTYASPEQTAAVRAPDLPEKKKQRNRALERAVRDGFLAALETLTDDGRSAAVDTLEAFETDLLEKAPTEALSALSLAKREVARGLAEKNPESLVPLVTFQMDLYHHYRDEGRFGLATQARTLAADLAELYAKQGDAESAPVVASRALAILGGDLLEARVWTLGQRLLRRALELDPANEAAMLLLASQQEKVGQYGDAVDTLRELVRRNPKSAEGRLRLALNLERSGRAGAAVEMLQSLISENNPPWTLTVAYSELADWYLETGRTGEASNLLRRALDRLPRQAGLSVQLAYALDRQRRFREARQVLERLEFRQADPGDSPRHRYAAWPQKGLEEARSLLADGASARTPLLGMVLKDIGDGDDPGQDERKRNRRS